MPNGIERIVIVDQLRGRGAYRFEQAKPYQPAANAIYREIFKHALLPGEGELHCDKDEFMAGYDRAFGTDVFLHFRSGMHATLQEKFLTTTYDTVTVEYYQNPRTQEEGDWFKMRIDYYFVGYIAPGTTGFRKWILLHWPNVRDATNDERIPWLLKSNTKDGARANFKYVSFQKIPIDCVVAKEP